MYFRFSLEGVSFKIMLINENWISMEEQCLYWQKEMFYTSLDHLSYVVLYSTWKRSTQNSSMSIYIGKRTSPDQYITVQSM